jgi:alkylation response protein AidB-like acyl-CoA dehydrogenase
MSGETGAGTAADLGKSMDVKALLDRVDAIRPLLESHAAEQEQMGCLHGEAMRALHGVEAFSICAPREVGGLELSPIDALEVIARISHAEASAGWVTFVASTAAALVGALLGEDAVAEIFGGGGFPIVVGVFNPPGTAVPEPGGFRISGEWSFLSGVKHAAWARIVCGVEGTGERRIFVVPTSDAELIENWDVMGLRATGSIDMSIDDLHVPAEFTYAGTAETPLRGGPILALGTGGALTLLGHTGWALGVGRRLLDELRALAGQRAERPRSWAHSDAFRMAYADAEASLRAAAALVSDVWGEAIEEAVERGNQLSVRQHTMLRLALAHATLSAQAAAQVVYQWSGTTGLRAGTIQRFFRDLHAGAQHVTSGPGVRAACGQELLGAAPNQKWQYVFLSEG